MKDTQTTNEEMKRIISEAIRANTTQEFSVYLFGSRARGDNAPDSDYDFLMVVNDELDKKAKSMLSKAIRKLLAERLVGNGDYFGSDVIIKSAKDYENAEEGTFLHAIKQECVRL